MSTKQRRGVPEQVQRVIDELTADQKIIGECQQCGESAPMSEWNLFYMNAFPGNAKDRIDEYLNRPKEQEEAYDLLKRKSTVLAAQKSVTVMIGEVFEEAALGLSTFPYHRADCRGLFDPIDYVVFDGLSREGKVSKIHFVDVKTGASRLNEHQKQVKTAIEKKRVEFTLY